MTELIRLFESALEAKDKRIAHLEEMFNGWRDEARKADARIAQLTAALKPFANAQHPSDVSVGDLRAARAAYLEENNG